MLYFSTIICIIKTFFKIPSEEPEYLINDDEEDEDQTMEEVLNVMKNNPSLDVSRE